MDSVEMIRKEIMEMIEKDEIRPAKDLYEIEGLAILAQEYIQKQEFYKEYKKRKIADIDNEIKKMEVKEDFVKKVISATLKEQGQKGVHFPGTCKISTRKNKPKWVINDEEKFRKMVEEAFNSGENVAGVIKEVTTSKIVKTEADNLLNAWESNGKLDALRDSSDDTHFFATKEEGAISVILKYEDREEDEEDIKISIPKKDEVKYDGI